MCISIYVCILVYACRFVYVHAYTHHMLHVHITCYMHTSHVTCTHHMLHVYITCYMYTSHAHHLHSWSGGLPWSLLTNQHPLPCSALLSLAQLRLVQAATVRGCVGERRQCVGREGGWGT